MSFDCSIRQKAKTCLTWEWQTLHRPWRWLCAFSGEVPWTSNASWYPLSCPLLCRGWCGRHATDTTTTSRPDLGPTTPRISAALRKCMGSSMSHCLLLAGRPYGSICHPSRTSHWHGGIKALGDRAPTHSVSVAGRSLVCDFKIIPNFNARISLKKNSTWHTDGGVG